MKQEYRAYVGTYTRHGSEGIYTFLLDTERTEIRSIELIAKEFNPTYLTLHPQQNYLISAIEGGIASYRILEQGRKLALIHRVVGEIDSPCHLHVNETGDIVSAYYGIGQLVSQKANDQGEILQHKSVIQHHGSGPNKARQEGPHIHYSYFIPRTNYIAVVDLGLDAIITYLINHNQELVEVQRLQLEPGCGPRHLDFHPTNNFAYCITELSNELIVLNYDSEGKFKVVQTISTLPTDYTETSYGSAIHLSKDGRFVYVSNRGHDSIASFSVHFDGTVVPLEHISTVGHWPRDFEIDPSDHYLICANERSHHLVLYSRDTTTGRLTFLQSNYTIDDAVCIKFLK